MNDKAAVNKMKQAAQAAGAPGLAKLIDDNELLLLLLLPLLGTVITARRGKKKDDDEPCVSMDWWDVRKQDTRKKRGPESWDEIAKEVFGNNADPGAEFQGQVITLLTKFGNDDNHFQAGGGGEYVEGKNPDFSGSLPGFQFGIAGDAKAVAGSFNDEAKEQGHAYIKGLEKWRKEVGAPYGIVYYVTTMETSIQPEVLKAGNQRGRKVFVFRSNLQVKYECDDAALTQTDRTWYVRIGGAENVSVGKIEGVTVPDFYSLPFPTQGRALPRRNKPR
jgi:hypothetical protein